MEENKQITKKLQQIVKQRNTPIVVKKQESGYKIIRRSRISIVGEIGSYFFEDE